MVTHILVFRKHLHFTLLCIFRVQISCKIMPLFTKKYESKPTPPRSARCNIGCPAISEDLDEFKNISLNLGSKELRFADGIWIHSTRKTDTDDVIRLNRRIRTLEEENNMCNLKMEIFLDLLAEQTTELNLFKTKNM